MRSGGAAPWTGIRLARPHGLVRVNGLLRATRGASLRGGLQ
jgi:hypothetical protein